MAVQLFSKKQGTETFVALDLNDAEPIKLNLSVANIIDPTATNSVFSRTFKVPHTSINGPYFKGVFNVNSMDFDAAAKADAYILDNGIFFENGNIRLNAIYTNSEDNSVEYEITFYGSTSDFGSKIGGGFLNEVNLNAFNHTKNYENITASWTGNLFNYDVVYGLIEWGYTYDNTNRPILPTLSFGFDKSFTNSVNPYKLQQWKPQIRAKALWDQIFEEAGYTYDSTFLDSDFFKKQYIISDNEARAELDNANTFRAENQGVTYQVLGAQFPWVTPIEIADPGSNFMPSDTVSGIYTAPASGNYTFEMKADQVETYIYGSGQDSAVIGYEAKAIDVDTGQVVGLDVSTWTFDPQLPFTQTLNADMYTNLNANQKIRFELRTFRISGPIITGGTQIQFYGTSVECTDAPNIMSFNAIMPSNIRKIDFMKSIINRYRLVFEPSKFQANHFTITPWKDWILAGRSKDWTDRLDISKDMVIKPLFFDQARFQIYKDQEDSDYLNYNYQLGIKQTFGQLNLDSTNELIKGTKEYKDQFAPSPLDGIGFKSGTTSQEQAAATFLIPHMAKDTGGNGASEGTGASAVSIGKREPIQPKLRLVFWNGVKAVPTGMSWYMAKNPAADPVFAEQRFDYPMMSQYSEWPVTSTTFDLNWENEEPLYNIDLVSEYFSNNTLTNPRAQTGFSCFNTFWKTWYDVTFDPYSRIVEAYFALDYNEILDLKFNDYIFVKDAWYFVNSITDYVTGQTSNCRVQLIKLGNNIGITLPVVTPPTYFTQETCYHPEVKCTAACCATYDGSTTATIYTDSLSLATSTIAYQDQFGGILAAPGYYKNDSGTIFVNGNGAIAVQTTTECNCVPVYYTFTAFVNTTGCNVCCVDGPTVTLYGANPVFEQNGIFFQDQLLTIPVPAGFYKQSGGTFALQVIPNGTVVNNFLCDTCNCTVYYPFTVCSASSLCDACCCFSGTITIYGENATFANNTTLYLDNTGTQKVPNGFYKLNDTTVAQVTGGEGAVTAFAICTTCIPCPAGPVEVTVNVSAQVPGYTTSTLLQKSYDNGVNWVDIGTVTIEASDPANTQKSQLFTTELDVRVRAISSTNTANGFIQTYYAIGINQFENTTVATPATRTVTISSPVTDEYMYEFNAIVTGGDPLEGDKIVVVGQYDDYQGGSTIGSILAVDATDADVNVSYNTGVGFTGSSVTAPILSSTATDGTSLYAGINLQSAISYRAYYKDNQITKSVIKINQDGSFDTTFNSNWPDNVNVINVIAHVANNKVFANKPGPIIIISGNYQYSITSTDLNGVVDTGWTSPVFLSPLTTNPINKILFYNNLYYIFGAFTIVNGTTRNRVVVLNTDGSVNTTESDKFGTAFSGNVQDAYIYGTTLVVGGNFSQYKGVASGALLALDITTGDILSGFVGSTAALIITGVLADASGIYASKQTATGTWKGAAIGPVFKLDYSGNIISAFSQPVFTNVGYLTTSSITVGKIMFDANGNILVPGRFNRVNSNTYGGLVKLDKTDGSIITQFNIGAGFTKTIPNTYISGAPTIGSITVINNNCYVNGTYSLYKTTESYIITAVDASGDIVSGFNSGTGVRIALSLNTFNLANASYIGIDSSDNTYVRLLGATAIEPNGNGSVTALTGTPFYYKGTELTTDVVKIDKFGVLDATFNTNISSVTPMIGSQFFKIVNDKIYRFGQYVPPTGGSTPQLVRYNLDGTIDNTFTPITNAVIQSTIGDIIEHNNLLYLTSSLFSYGGGLRQILVVNLDGTINATETAKFNRFSTTVPAAGFIALKVYNDILYVLYSNSSATNVVYDNVESANVIAANLSDGTTVSGFTTNKGFRQYVPLTSSYLGGGVYSFDIDSTGIYVANQQGTYNSVACSKVAKIDFTGNIINTFDIGAIDTTSAGSNIGRILLDGNNLYVTGTFSTVDGTTTKGLVKVDKTTGDIVTAFDVNSGFTFDATQGNTTKTNDLVILPGAGITLYPINTSYSNESPCAAYCATPYSTTIYGNGLSLTQSTVLYTNANGSIPAAAGWYSDGGSIAQVDGNGIIISYTNVSTCSCNTLYSFEVAFDIETCVACGTTGTPANTTVWGANQNWSSNQVLYTNAQGTAFAASGWYAYASSIALNVGNNGFVQNSVDCFNACGTSGNCVGYSISNGTGNVISYSYITCFDQSIVFGEIYPGDPTFYTGCAVEGSVAAPGANIQQVAIC